MAGKHTSLEDIEAHYCQSPFVKEVCLLDFAEPGGRAPDGPYGFIVPDMALMRARKIVNIGDLLRFELEGLSHTLPVHQRLAEYVVSFDPLPRTPAQQIDRGEVARLVRVRHARARQPEASLSGADVEWLREPHAAMAVRRVRARAKGGRVWPDANLELDLGLDSVERVELLTELEGAFGIKVPQQEAAELFTVRQLVESFRSAAERIAQTAGKEQSWATILRDLPAVDDPRLAWLLRKRSIAAPVLFVMLRIVRLLFVRVSVDGLDRLPASGPYLITPNHQSYVDPFILCGVLPYRVFRELFFVGAVEYFETPLTRWVAYTANLVPVDPDSNLIPAMKAGAFGLAHGRILMLFPEGERSIDGTVRKFKKGAPILAQHLEVPMVPVALKGIHELWPRNRGINWRMVAPWSGHRIAIRIGEPLTPAAGTDYNDSASRLRDRVNAMWLALSS